MWTIDMVLGETQRDYNVVTRQLKGAMADLAAILYVTSDKLHNGESTAIPQTGIIQGKASEIDALCARYTALQQQLERLEWAKRNAAGVL